MNNPIKNQVNKFRNWIIEEQTNDLVDEYFYCLEKVGVRPKKGARAMVFVWIKEALEKRVSEVGFTKFWFTGYVFSWMPSREKLAELVKVLEFD